MRTFAECWPREEIVQGPLAQLPWYHQIALLEKLNDNETRLCYASGAIAEGWSRDILVHQIETRLHERSGHAVTNFAATPPPEDSDLAQQLAKDPYVFDFLALANRRSERELETQLVTHVQKFLPELGQGFAFVGEQVRLGSVELKKAGSEAADVAPVHAQLQTCLLNPSVAWPVNGRQRLDQQVAIPE